MKILTLGLLISVASQAQEKCATNLIKVNEQETEAHFEYWLSQKLHSNFKSGAKGTHKTKSVIQIPVVVHVIHNGEPIGTGVNISDAQIQSQIDVLNEDFRRLNADASNTPDIFEPFAADLEIEFVLALQDPEGLPSEGIVRVEGHKNNWEVSETNQISDLSYWPAEDYMNIWVTNLVSPYLGYAQFPVSDLIGLESASHNRLTDGVVIDYMAFGSEEKYPAANLDSQYNRGRTATHEVGHFLGLRHIWGDGDCENDDYADDTPISSEHHANYGGSCSFPGPNTCDEGEDDLPDMFQNFMDYTDDKCMNLFTISQKERVQIVLAESPRRASLPSSPGLDEPQLVALDLGIKSIIDPVVAICGDEIQPSLEIRNYGETTVTAYQIEFYLDDQLMESQTITDASLPSLELDTVIFASQPLQPAENFEMHFEITSVNNTTDFSNANIMSLSVPYYENQELPFHEDFEDFESEDWEIYNYDKGETWSIVNAPFFNEFNDAIATDFYSDENVGEQDLLVSMPFYIPEDSSALLSFYVAYARYNTESNEGLMVKISDDCGNNFDDIVFEKYGPNLQTVSPRTSKFVPSGENDWRQEIIDLSAYEGSNIRIAFVAINEYGNNLYLDEIQLNASGILDLELVKIVSPNPAQCEDMISPVLLMRNNGSQDIYSASIELTINGTTKEYSVEFSNNLEPNESVEVLFPDVSVPVGENTIEFNITSVNNQSLDFYGFNNTLFRTFLIDHTTEQLPLQEDFEDFSTSNWKILNMDNDITWEVSSKTGNSFASFPSPKYVIQKDEDWIISPVLDFSEVDAATLFFDLKYSGNTSDRLRLVYTDDCGTTYKSLSYDKQGQKLNTSNETRRESVSLEELIGKSDVRIAFIATGAQGSNIDIDNIEIFLEDTHSPYKFNENVVVHPNPASGSANITFSLEQKENVNIIITNQSGKVFSTYNFQNILNQTHRLNMQGLSQGVYLIKIQGETFQDVKKLVLF